MKTLNNHYFQKDRTFRILPTLMILSVLTTCFLLAEAATRKMRLKLATLAPTGSCYHQSLLRMAEAWKEASDGAISLVIYADGKLGGEADTVGLMEIGSIQAAMLTGVGLVNIEPDVTALHSIPMLFRTEEEMDHLGSVLRSKLDAKMKEKGYSALFWGDAGFVRFFSKVPIGGISDMRRLKVFVKSGSPEQVEAFKKAGFNTIPLETADIASSLQTGLIDVTPAPTIYALATQIDRIAPYMLDINWAPMVGALVVKESVWEKIPLPLRTELREAAEKAGEEIKAQSRKESVDAIHAMENRGLKTIRLEDDKMREWREVVETSYPLFRGTVVPQQIYDEALAIMQDWRRKSSLSE